MSAEPLHKDNVVPLTLPKAKNVIAVASGKGGVGKTFVSSTLAHALSRSGKNVLLFDADLGMANIDVQLGLMPEHDLGSVIAGHVRLDQAIYSCNDQHQEGPSGRFDILAGKSGSGTLATLSPSQIKGLAKGIMAIAQTYDVVIIDMPAGIDAAVTQLSLICNRVYMVLTDEPTSLTDAYAFIKVVSRHDPQTDFQVIVNQVDQKSDAKQVFQSLAQACKSFLDLDITNAGAVRRDKKVKEAIRYQMPLLKRFTESHAGSDLSKIAKDISI